MFLFQNKENEQKVQETKTPATPQKEKKVLTGNVAIEDLRVGTGATAKAGKMVQVCTLLILFSTRGTHAGIASGNH